MKTLGRVMTVMFVTAAFGVVDTTPSRAASCQLAQQLERPELRTLYEMRINEVRESFESYVGTEARFSTEIVLPNGDRQVIDIFSRDCMVCHDGQRAPYHNVQIRNGRRQRSISIDNVVGNHPIGMPYGLLASDENSSLRPGSPDQKILLVDGLVGCLSCHDMLNPSRYHLVVDNEGSSLCLQCHAR